MTKRMPESGSFRSRVYTLLLLTLLLGACTTPPQYVVELDSNMSYPIWVHGIYFGSHRFPVGGTSGGKVIIMPENIPIPDEARISWNKMVHYKKYAAQKKFTATIPIPKPLPPLNGARGYRFIFTINRDKTVTLDITRQK